MIHSIAHMFEPSLLCPTFTAPKVGRNAIAANLVIGL